MRSVGITMHRLAGRLLVFLPLPCLHVSYLGARLLQGSYIHTICPLTNLPPHNPCLHNAYTQYTQSLLNTMYTLPTHALNTNRKHNKEAGGRTNDPMWLTRLSQALFDQSKCNRQAGCRMKKISLLKIYEISPFTVALVSHIISFCQKVYWLNNFWKSQLWPLYSFSVFPISKTMFELNNWFKSYWQC